MTEPVQNAKVREDRTYLVAGAVEKNVEICFSKFES